ncbi:MAG: hypothetical protein KGJ87_07575 [Planctomycetota bacterium]|nr:hypothetical protein [Planctomycetota bacterium]MDE2216999.1 hypothetical protein [Planctomycetota bacterium]
MVKKDSNVSQNTSGEGETLKKGFVPPKSPVKPQETQSEKTNTNKLDKLA